MDKKLHIVSFDVPWPANYGGVIDIFYKIKALHAAGIKITLHCFLYGKREAAPELALYCEEIFYYKRTTGVQGLSLLRPYIVNSRKSPALLKNLLLNDAPILFEGLHTCYFLNHPNLANRKKYVRAHNIEHEYYNTLASAEASYWKRLFFKSEAKLLAQYEVILKEANKVFAIAEKDFKYFTAQFKTEFIPAFHSNSTVTSQPGNGEYCLYQGNLSVSENKEAVTFLIETVFSKLDYAVKIAGAKPSNNLVQKLENYAHIELIADPSEEEMSDLVANAHINIVYAKKRSGLKLKLLNALFQGRFLVANEQVLESKKLQSVAKIANTSEVFVNNILRLREVEFSTEDIENRKRLLSEEFSNEANAQKIVDEIFA